MWSCGPVLPTSLIALLDKTAEEAEEIAEEEEEQKLFMKNFLVLMSRFKNLNGDTINRSCAAWPFSHYKRIVV